MQLAFALQQVCEIVSSAPQARRVYAGTARVVYDILKAFVEDLHQEYDPSWRHARLRPLTQRSGALRQSLFETNQFHSVLEMFREVMAPWGISLDYEYNTRGDEPEERIYSLMSMKLFGGYVKGRRDVVMQLNGRRTVREALTWTPKELLHEYARMLRHEYTHVGQGVGMRASYRQRPYDTTKAMRAQRRQLEPDTLGYLTSRAEVMAAANEFVELLRQGYPLRKDPRYQSIAHLGREHEAVKRLHKQMYVILQDEKDPRVMQRFREQIRQQ